MKQQGAKLVLQSFDQYHVHVAIGCKLRAFEAIL